VIGSWSDEPQESPIDFSIIGHNLGRCLVMTNMDLDSRVTFCTSRLLKLDVSVKHAGQTNQ